MGGVSSSEFIPCALAFWCVRASDLEMEIRSFEKPSKASGGSWKKAPGREVANREWRRDNSCSLSASHTAGVEKPRTASIKGKMAIVVIATPKSAWRRAVCAGDKSI